MNNPTQTGLKFGAIAVALTTVCLAVMGWSGGLSGGQSQCGQWGFGCVAIAGAVALAGTVIGTILALAYLTRSGWKSAFGWFWLVLNAMPAVGLGLLALFIFSPH